MAYEAALEALLIGETENGVDAKLADRLPVALQDRRSEVGSFARRVFWLRSKVAHGVRDPSEIQRLVVREPDRDITDPARGKSIPGGPYSMLFIEAGVFPSFLVNLRECVRRIILLFCDEYLAGRGKDATLAQLDK
jgi:hypothetical protein